MIAALHPIEPVAMHMPQLVKDKNGIIFRHMATVRYQILNKERRYRDWSDNLITRGHAAEDISVWCDNTCTGRYRVSIYDKKVQFEEPNDAILFMMAFA